MKRHITTVALVLLIISAMLLIGWSMLSATAGGVPTLTPPSPGGYPGPDPYPYPGPDAYPAPRAFLPMVQDGEAYP